MQHTATHCNTLKHLSPCVLHTHTHTHMRVCSFYRQRDWQLSVDAATHCNSLQHTATHCNTLQHLSSCILRTHTHTHTHVCVVFIAKKTCDCQWTQTHSLRNWRGLPHCSGFHCKLRPNGLSVAVYCSVLQRVAVYCSVM